MWQDRTPILFILFTLYNKGESLAPLDGVFYCKKFDFQAEEYTIHGYRV